jgi:REP-associated tyrosine transposase
LLVAFDLGYSRSRTIIEEGGCCQCIAVLSESAKEKKIYMRINYVNADHVHALIDLPTNVTIEEAVQLLKGSSSHWINSNDIIKGKFAWGRGYGAFAVSQSNLEAVCRYIASQEKHHCVRTFDDEPKEFVQRHGLKWRLTKAVETARI